MVFGEELMKISKILKLIALLMAMLSVASCLCGCLDLDEMAIDFGLYDEKKKVNDKFEVMLREKLGFTCTDDEAQKSVFKGDSAIFHIRIDNGYVYMGNTAGATYDAATGTLKIDSVEAPTTIDVLVGNQNDLYCVELSAPSDIRVEFRKGGPWSETPEEITVYASFTSEYRFITWEIDGLITTESHIESPEFTFTPAEKGVIRIKAVVGPAIEGLGLSE